MGLQFNLIKTCAKTLNQYGTMGANDCIKVVRLGKKSPYRSWDFCEIFHGPKGWEICGENPREFSIFFPNNKKKELQKFIRQHTTGTTVQETADKTIVSYGMGHKPYNGQLFGFEKTKDTITYYTQLGNVTFARSSKSKIKDFLSKLLEKFDETRKWSIQEFDKRLCEDFSEEMVKPVHDYLEGKLSKEKLVELIRKYRKNTFYNPVIPESESALVNLENMPAAYLPKELLDKLDIHPILRRCSLMSLYNMSGHGNEQAKILLDEFFRAKNINSSQRATLYRYVSQEEVDKILSGEVVKSRGRFTDGNRFDVTTKRNWTYNQYRVRFNTTVDENTISSGKITSNKPEFSYYHWNTSQYDIKDVRSIFDTYSKKTIYESEEEILVNFISEYLSKLG